MFKGRFGDFYLYKIWIFTVVFGAVLAPAVGFLIILGEWNEEFFMFILLQMIYGIVLCIPSLILSDVFYKFLSKSKLTDYELFIYGVVFSLIVTNLTYYVFFNYGNLNEYFKVFSISYSTCLVAGFFIFKQKPENLKF